MVVREDEDVPFLWRYGGFQNFFFEVGVVVSFNGIVSGHGGS